ncbi:MAG: hypothetical protein ABIP20_03350 [Chthoniobacteraceae bacterium]
MAAALVLALGAIAFAATDLASLCEARMAVERVYYGLRNGEKPPIEEALPPSLIEKLVRDEIKKEIVLERAYGVRITEAVVAAEVQRIDFTTRAPEVLAEIKAALGNDPVRFARTVARPIIVERLLRERFENDALLHTPQRRAVEAARSGLLAVKDGSFRARLAVLREGKNGEFQEQVTWELSPRPVAGVPASQPPVGPTQVKARSGAYTNEATAQVAQVLSSPTKPGDEAQRKAYFEDLPGDLQNVLRVQLRQPGDVSAVIESQRAFQLYLVRERSSAALSAAVLTIPKRSYEEWLASQPD